MNRKKLLLENFLVYGIGGVISKIIPFVMLPIITYLLPNETYFGINDLFTTVTSLCTAIGIFGMWDTAFRFFFDENDINYKKKICSTSFCVSLIFTVISCIVLMFMGKWIAKEIYGDSGYLFLVWFNVGLVITSNIGTMLSAPTRILNQRKIYFVVNTLSPVITYLIAIVLIYKGWYVSALPLAALLAAIIMMVVFWSLNRRWFSWKSIDKSNFGDLIRYGLPLMPQHLMYYVINSSDKLMIASFLGQSANGLYAVGGKFGHISQLIYAAFAGGWTYYRYATMNAEDQVENISKIFEYLGAISFACFSFACVFSRVVIQLMFRDIYYESFIVIPYLFLAPLMQMLFQTAGGQFTIIKKTWINLLILITGTLINVTINYFLIPQLGIEGAAIATLTGYAITVVLSIIICSKIKMIRISNRFYVMTFATLGFYIFWRLNISLFILPLTCAVILSIFILYLYKNDIRLLLKRKS